MKDPTGITVGILALMSLMSLSIAQSSLPSCAVGWIRCSRLAAPIDDSRLPAWAPHLKPLHVLQQTKHVFAQIPLLTLKYQSASSHHVLSKNNSVRAFQWWSFGFPSLTKTLATLNLTSIACSAPVRNKTKTYRNVGIIFYALSTASVALRFIARFIRGFSIWYDDWIIVLILVSIFLLSQPIYNPKLLCSFWIPL